MEGVDLIVELGNEFVEGFLESLEVGVLLGLHIAYDLGQLGYQLYALSEVVLIFLLNLQLELCQYVVVLPVQVYLVSVALEVLVRIVQIVVLLYEILNVLDCLL